MTGTPSGPPGRGCVIGLLLGVPSWAGIIAAARWLLGVLG